MANPNPKPSLDTRFKKGQSGNPGGAPKNLGEILALRKYNKEKFDTRLTEFMNMSMEDIEKIRDDRKAIGFDIMLASTILKAWELGCPTRMSMFWNRLIGPVKGTYEIRSDLPETHIELDKPKEVDEQDFYIVEMNEGGKFKRQRPRLVEAKVVD